MYRRDHGRCLPHAVRVSRRKKITCRTCQTCHSGDGVKTDESLVVFIGRGFVCRKATRSIVFSCTLWRRGTSRCFGVSSRTRCKHLCESRVDLKSRQLVIVQRYGFSPLTRYVRLIFSLNVKRYDFDMSALLFIYLFNKKISLRSQDHLVSFAKFLPRPILLIMKEISLNKPVGSFESRLSSHACRLCLAVFHWQATIMGPVSIFFFPPSALHDSLIAQPWFIAFLYMYISLFFFSFRLPAERQSLSGWRVLLDHSLPHRLPLQTAKGQFPSFWNVLACLCDVGSCWIVSVMPVWGNGFRHWFKGNGFPHSDERDVSSDPPFQGKTNMHVSRQATFF